MSNPKPSDQESSSSSSEDPVTSPDPISDPEGPRPAGRPFKGWEPVNLRLRPEARARLQHYKAILGVEMGTIVSALILQHLEALPTDRLPQSTTEASSNLREILVQGLSKAGASDEDIRPIFDLLKNAANIEDSVDMEIVLENEFRTRDMLKKALKVLKSAFQPPLDTPEHVTWLRRRVMAIQGGQELYEVVRRRYRPKPERQSRFSGL